MARGSPGITWFADGAIFTFKEPTTYKKAYMCFLRLLGDMKEDWGDQWMVEIIGDEKPYPAWRSEVADSTAAVGFEPGSALWPASPVLKLIGGPLAPREPFSSHALTQQLSLNRGLWEDRAETFASSETFWP